MPFAPAAAAPRRDPVRLRREDDGDAASATARAPARLHQGRPGSRRRVAPAADRAQADMSKRSADAMAARALRVLASLRFRTSRSMNRSGFRRSSRPGHVPRPHRPMDPPRDEAYEAVAAVPARGHPAGDGHRRSQSHGPGRSARALGIARDGDLAVDGRELEQMPEQDLRRDSRAHLRLRPRASGAKAPHRRSLPGRAATSSR